MEIDKIRGGWPLLESDSMLRWDRERKIVAEAPLRLTDVIAVARAPWTLQLPKGLNQRADREPTIVSEMIIRSRWYGWSVYYALMESMGVVSGALLRKLRNVCVLFYPREARLIRSCIHFPQWLRTWEESSD